MTIECLGRYFRLRKMGMNVLEFDKKEEKTKEINNSKEFIVAIDEMRGHTGYLTFARKH